MATKIENEQTTDYCPSLDKHGHVEQTTDYCPSLDKHGHVEKCAFYVLKRGRNCRMMCVRGSRYCAEHLLNDPDAIVESGRRRVACPLDPSHTVFEDQVSRHVRKCNVAKRVKPSCYCEGVHVVKGVEDPSPVSLSNIPQDELTQLIQRVQSVFKTEYVGDNIIEERVSFHSSMDSDLCDPLCGPKAAKHLSQQSSILAHLDRLSLLLRTDVAYIEFGAGRGKLSEKILHALDHPHNVHLVLVDKALCRRKADGAFRKASLEGASYHRLLMNIQDLDLSAVSVLDGVSSVVGVSKHLCGVATDLCLRCIVRGRTEKFLGALIALCCHHRTSWSQLAGREYFTNLGFSAHDFELIRHMTSWAVCGVRGEQGGYTPHPYEDIGIQCKRLIDFARISYLRSHGFSVQLLYYVDRSTSLENVLMLIQ